MNSEVIPLEQIELLDDVELLGPIWMDSYYVYPEIAGEIMDDCIKVWYSPEESVVSRAGLARCWNLPTDLAMLVGRALTQREVDQLYSRVRVFHDYLERV